jgi:hypothetical protein
VTDTSIASLISHFAPTDKTYAVINPTSAKRIYDLPQLSAEQVAIEVDRARDAQANWASLEVSERAKIMLKLHDLMLDNKDKFLDLLQLETGKSRMHAVEEFAGSIGATRYYAKISDKALSIKTAKTDVPFLIRSFVAQVPIGVVGVITPWNYPLALAMMDVIPAIMAGNSVVQKADNQTTLVSLFARAMAVQAGLPEDVWRIVVGDGAEVGNAVTDNVDYVAFTGSTATGRHVAQRAAGNALSSREYIWHIFYPNDVATGINPEFTRRTYRKPCSRRDGSYADIACAGNSHCLSCSRINIPGMPRTVAINPLVIYSGTGAGVKLARRMSNAPARDMQSRQVRVCRRIDEQVAAGSNSHLLSVICVE